jgi:uncharacterized protein (TIGR02594 family)
MVLKRLLQIVTLQVLMSIAASLTFHMPANAEPTRPTSESARLQPTNHPQPSTRPQSDSAEFSASKRRSLRNTKSKVKKRKAKKPRSHARTRSTLAGRSAHRTPVNPLVLDEQAMIVRPEEADSELVAEARRWIGTNPTDRASLWCATFMNFVLERTGRVGTGSDLARSFANYGQLIYGPQVGAIAVMTRGKNGGHVGVVSGIDPKGNPIVVSGNYGRTVAEAVIPYSRVYAYVLPN